MRKTKTQLILLLCILLSACQPKTDSWVKTRNINGEDWQCISTYERFLYQMTKINRNSDLYSLPEIEPQEPWRFISEISFPDSPDPWKLIRANIEMARTVNDHTELWIRYETQFIKYIPDTENYTIVPVTPSDGTGKEYEDVKITGILETSTGQIIGVNYPLDHDTEWQEEMPLFSIYNETENKFFILDIGLTYSQEQIEYGYEEYIGRYGVLVSHDENLIWIYQQEEGLYSFDPHTSKLQHYHTSITGAVRKMIATDEGFLWFNQKLPNTWNDDTWKLKPGEILKYFPDLQTVEEIHVPFFRWPNYGVWLYTDSGDLWLDIHGYLSKDGKWVLKNPNRITYNDLGASSTTYNWMHPYLILQSSNGYLWYTNKKYDLLGVNGAAWIDPETNKGCWFTNQPASLIEDQNHTLWMLIGNQVYKYELDE